MEIENKSRGIDFYITGFTDVPQLRTPLLLLFLIMYVFTLLRNIIIILTVLFTHHLHIPMYFFLINLSFLDISFTTVTVPNLLNIFITGIKRITFIGCMMQLYFFLSFASAEYFLLTVMAYNRFVAICRPLYYHLILNKRMCVMMAGSVWVVGFVGAIPLIVFISSLDFCSSSEVNHLFCDMMPLLKMSCSDTVFTQMVMYSQGVLLVMTCFLLTLASYCFIIATIFKIHSSERRLKAFSTCSSHLSIVILFYIVIFSLYMRPPSSYHLSQSKVTSVLFVQVVPLCNPIIYSLRNTDIKQALRKALHAVTFLIGN